MRIPIYKRIYNVLWPKEPFRLVQKMYATQMNVEEETANRQAVHFSTRATSYGSVDNVKSNEETQNTTYQHEFKEIGTNSIPLIFTFVLQSSLSMMTIFFVGRLGALELGAVSLANVTFTVTSAVFIGMATCLDTMCPQAFGAKQYRLVGLYFQRSCAISFVFAIPIALTWYYSSSLLSRIIDDPALVNISSRYLKVMIMSIPGYVVFESGKKFLQAQGNFTTGQHILFICAPLNMVLNYLLIFKLDLGYIGAPIATTLSYNLMGLFLICYICYKNITTEDTEETPDCWNRIESWDEIFSNWNPMISLAVPGIIMIEAEFLAFELLTVLAAKFGTTVLAAQSVTASIQSLTFQVPFSIGVAASNRIAYHIGTKNIWNCQIATRTTVIQLGFIVGFGNFLFLLLGRYKISSLFSNDPEVVEIAAKLLPIIGVNQLYDVFNVLAAGCLRAQGRQKIGGYLNLAAYYLLGLPLAVLLGFKYNMKAQGFWIGLGCGILVLALSELYCLYKSNWPKVVKNSQNLHNKK